MEAWRRRALRCGAGLYRWPFRSRWTKPVWASRVEELGVGPAPIPDTKLSRDTLARALERAITDRAMQARASEFGAAIRSDDGVGNAVRVCNERA